MKSHMLEMLVVAALATGVAGSASAMTNEYIECTVDVQASSGRLALQLSQPTWYLESVPQGGVKDTWFGEATHGKFWVRNDGDTNAAIFITAAGAPPNQIEPDVYVPPDPMKFAMAVATNVEALLPAWKVLDQSYPGSQVGRYMRALIPGDYMLFDLRFYAGSQLNPQPGRTFRLYVYATSGEAQTPP